MKRAKIIKFVNLHKKQIIFALFAFICFTTNKNSGVLICVAPLMSNIPNDPEQQQKKSEEGQAAQKVGATAARATADYFTGGKYEQLRNKPIVGDVAKAAENTVGKVAGAAANVATLGGFNKAAKKLDDVGALDAANKGLDSFGGGMGKNPTGVPKNTNPNPNAMTSKSSISAPTNAPKNDSIQNNKGISTDVGNKETDATKSSNGSNNTLSSQNKSNSNSNKSLETKGNLVTNTEASDKYMKKFSVVGALGCIGVLFGALIIFFPAILLSGGLMTKNTMTRLDCTLSDTEDCEEDESGNFFSNMWNYIKYGTYGTNTEVTANILKEIYEDIEDEYDFRISIPLLSSSLFYEATDTLEYDENGDATVSDDGEMMSRLKYAKDLALLQIIKGETVYECKEVEVDGKKKYREVPMYEPVAEELIVSGKCNSDNVNKYIKKIENNKYDEEAYFQALLESDLLVKIYSDYYEDFDDEKAASEMIVNNIRDSYNMYKALYIRDESDDKGGIPENLMSDTNVNLQCPLKGNISITSPFGDRPLFGDFHKGIDVISGDTTIYAAGDGVVKTINESCGGNIVEITHIDSNGNEYKSQYAHMRERWVKSGDTVSAGDPIGIMGASGSCATGVHLHFGFYSNSSKEWLDPINLFTEALNYNDF